MLQEHILEHEHNTATINCSILASEKNNTTTNSNWNHRWQIQNMNIRFTHVCINTCQTAEAKLFQTSGIPLFQITIKRGLIAQANSTTNSPFKHEITKGAHVVRQINTSLTGLAWLLSIQILTCKQQILWGVNPFQKNRKRLSESGTCAQSSRKIWKNWNPRGALRVD